MKLRFEFSVEIDASLFQAVEALSPEEVRECAACEFAADITETDFYEKFVNKATWYRMGGSEIPYVVGHAAELGRSIRYQMELDSWGDFS